MGAASHAVRGRSLCAKSSRTRVTAVVVGSRGSQGVVLRVWLLRPGTRSVFDADEAVPGTMARHVLDGEIGAFYWGQGYGGTPRTAPDGGGVRADRSERRRSPVRPARPSSRSAPCSTWRIGVRTVGEPYARLGAAAFWVWSAYVVWKSTRAHGFYGAALVLGLAVVLLALRLEERPSTARVCCRSLALGTAGGRRLRRSSLLSPPSPGSSGAGAARSAPAPARARSMGLHLVGAAPVALRSKRRVRRTGARATRRRGSACWQTASDNLLARDAPDRARATPAVHTGVGRRRRRRCVPGRALLAAIVWTLVRRRTELVTARPGASPPFHCSMRFRRTPG